MARTEHRDFERFLRQHGLTLTKGGKHYKILKNGANVGSLAGTSSDLNVYRMATRQLVRDGHLPPHVKGVKF